MTYDEYWYGDVEMATAYLEAEKHRMKRMDEQAHLYGLYIYEALCDASPLYHDFAKPGTKAYPYRTESYTAELEKNAKKQAKDKEEQEREEALFAEAYMKQMMQAGKNWGKKK